MESGNYNKISGKKTLILVVGLIAVIIILSVYSVYLILRKNAVITQSTSYEKPAKVQTIQEKPSDIPTDISKFPTRNGD